MATCRTKYDLRKFFFTNRVVNIWNSLPNKVIESKSVDEFKTSLDDHWRHEEIKYDYHAKLTGTGVRGLDI